MSIKNNSTHTSRGRTEEALVNTSGQAAMDGLELSEEMRTMLLKEVERFNYERKIMFETSMEKLKIKIKTGFVPSINELRRPLHWVDPDSQDGMQAMAELRKLLLKKGRAGEIRANQLEFTQKVNTLNSMILFMESNVKQGYSNNECSPEKLEQLKDEQTQYQKWLEEINAEDTSHGETINLYKPPNPVMRCLQLIGRELVGLFS